MKTLKFIAIAGFVAIMSVSCQEKPPVEEGENSQASAELVSFGFYLEDNADLIDKDYIASSLSQETVIRIPDGGSGKTLVARLEVGENDEALVNGESPVDGKISVDATYPIDVVVTDSESGLSSAYVIKVGKILGAEMVYVATYAESGADMYGYYQMKVNQTDGLPYIVYLSAADGQENRASVVKWNGSAFEPVGALGFTGTNADSRVRYPVLCFDNNGNPYVACRNDDNPDGEVSVYKYSGSWTSLGYTDEECSLSYEPLIFTNPTNNNPVVCYQGNNAYKRNAIYSIYDGAAMSPVAILSPNPFVQGTTTGVFSRARSVTVGDTVYMLCVFSNGGYWVYKFENNSFTPVIQNYHTENVHIICIAFKADAQGNLYAMFADNSAGGNYIIQLYKVDLENGTFVPVANQITSITESQRRCHFDFAINPVSGQIVAAYRGNNAVVEDNGIYFGYIEENTGLWSDFIKVDDTETSDEPFSVNYALDGTGYATVATDAGIKLYKIQTEEDVLPE